MLSDSYVLRNIYIVFLSLYTHDDPIMTVEPLSPELLRVVDRLVQIGAITEVTISLQLFTVT